MDCSAVLRCFCFPVAAWFVIQVAASYPLGDAFGWVGFVSVWCWLGSAIVYGFVFLVLLSLILFCLICGALVRRFGWAAGLVVIMIFDA
ncbi:hypothetical protein U1Q18_021363 [Sarracenia purpurea var. burkii]